MFFFTVALTLLVGAQAQSFCAAPNSCWTNGCPNGYETVANTVCYWGGTCCRKTEHEMCQSPDTCWSNGCPYGYEEQNNKVCYSSGYTCCKKAAVTNQCPGICVSHCIQGEVEDSTSQCKYGVCCVVDKLTPATASTEKPTLTPATGPIVTEKPATAKPTTETGGTGTVTDGSCGKTKYDSYRADGRIVGGRQAKKGEFPWQVQVQKYGSHWCGGTLLDDQWVLSAAHCFEDTRMSIYQFVLGQHNKFTNEGTEQTFSASKIIRHKNYVNGGVKYDIVLIKLNGRARFNEYVRTACMPSHNENFVGESNCIVSGWGALREGSGGPTILNAVQKPVISNSVCKQAYYNIYDYNICGGFAQGGKDACQGDSGGPYVCKKAGQPWKIVGVVSWGHGCARPGKYGVYSSVPYFYNWIKETQSRN